MKEHKWARLLAYITGMVNQELVLQNEYSAAENRILRAQLPKRVTLAGVTRHPTEDWMIQIARNATDDATGYLNQCRYVLHDRDSKFCAAFRHVLKAANVKCLVLPPHSANLNAYAERWVRSVKEECVSKLILFGKRSLRRTLTEYIDHNHHERDHQGKENLVLFPAASAPEKTDGPIRCNQRLGGLLKYYFRAA